MKYFNISADYDPKTTGKRDGTCAVNQKKNKSFIDKQQEKLFNTYIDKNLDNRERIFINKYETFNVNNFCIEYFPLTKSVKKLDFMTFCPQELGLQFLISKRVYKILSQYMLPIHNKICVVINSFNEEYFLIGFPMLEKNSYDFDKSTFFDYKNGMPVKYKNVDDFENAEYARSLAKPISIYLNSKFNYDVINTTKGIYFSSKIIEELQKENITGFKIIEGVLEN